MIDLTYKTWKGGLNFRLQPYLSIKNLLYLLFTIFFCSFGSQLKAEVVPQAKLIKPSHLNSPYALHRLAHPGTPFIQASHRFAFIGDEDGSFEAWAYPLKLCQDFKFSFLVEEAITAIDGKELAQEIFVTPASLTLRYVHQSFTVEAIYFSPPNLPVGFILLQVDTTVPLKIVCSFFPLLQPMWPAGLGGQYSYWDSRLHAYVISEPTGKNQAIIGSPMAKGISYTPAHMFSEKPQEFIISIPPSGQQSSSFWPIIITGGKGPRETFENIFSTSLAKIPSYYQETINYWEAFLNSTLSFTCPDEKLNLALSWAKISLGKLEVANPDLGRGLVAGLGPSGRSGRPGFGWFFGGDAYINSLGLTAASAFPLVKEALDFTTKWQREDGKMAHELSQAAGYLNWWRDYHYGYIHADTTPLFLVALESYINQSGDLEFLKKCWPAAVKAFEFCLQTDKNHDGLMDNREAGLGALEYGDLTNIQTDIYLAAIWVRALKAMKNMANYLQEEDVANQAEKGYQKALESYLAQFWDKEEQFFTYAFDTEGRQVKEISPWNTPGIMWKLGSTNQRKATLERLLKADLLTDWGVRSISAKSQYYQPVNYNYGAVWPFLNGWLTAALFENHFSLPATSLLRATASLTFEHALGAIAEVFSGATHAWLQEAVPWQGFSANAVIFPLIRGLLGLEGNAFQKKVVFHPQLPADWDKVKIKNFRVGQACFEFNLKRNHKTLSLLVNHHQGESFTFQFTPCFTRGTKIEKVLVDGENQLFQDKHENQAIWPEIELKISKPTHVIQIQIEPTLEIIPPEFPSVIGARNQGIKITRLEQVKDKIIMTAQGLSGSRYKLKITNAQKIKKLNGATLSDNYLLVDFPPQDQARFLTKTITIFLE